MNRNRRSPLACLAAAGLALAACARPAKVGLPSDALDAAIGAAIGDPNTCVLLKSADRGHLGYRYGERLNCTESLPACDRPGASSADKAMTFAAAGRTASCPSGVGDGRTVGWAEGRLTTKAGLLDYSVVMEGDSALPGQEIAARLTDAVAKAGL